MEAWLTVNETRIALGSVGPTFCYVRELQNLPTDSRGVLELIVDGETTVWDVTLPDGAVPFDHRVEIDFGRHCPERQNQTDDGPQPPKFPVFDTKEDLTLL